jgi:hypothetical protein
MVVARLGFVYQCGQHLRAVSFSQLFPRDQIAWFSWIIFEVCFLEAFLLSCSLAPLKKQFLCTLIGRSLGYAGTQSESRLG